MGMGMLPIITGPVGSEARSMCSRVSLERGKSAAHGGGLLSAGQLQLHLTCYGPGEAAPSNGGVGKRTNRSSAVSGPIRRLASLGWAAVSAYIS